MDAIKSVPFYNKNSWTLYGSQLSPFAQKVAATLAFASIPFKWVWQRENSVLDMIRAEARTHLIKWGILNVDIPESMSPLEEFPWVPFLLGRDGTNAYDSTHIASALWKSHTEALKHKPALLFLVHLIEEFFDEWGLYLVHHKRWTGKGNNSDAHTSVGNYLAVQEHGRLLPIPKVFLEKCGLWFERRQTNRLPYLFSVGKKGHETQQRSDLPASPVGDFETHSLLNASFEKVLCCVENVLTKRPFIMGNHPTVADCSIFGQLNMLALLDAGTRREMEQICPRTISWLDSIQTFVEDFSGQQRFRTQLTERGDTTNISSALYGSHFQFNDDLEELLKPLLSLVGHIFETFVPLMQANERAYNHHVSNGVRIFNEKAFDRKEALYTGMLLFNNHKFCSVAKTFQVKVWRDLKLEYSKLSVKNKHLLANALQIPNLSSVMLSNSTYSML